MSVNHIFRIFAFHISKLHLFMRRILALIACLIIVNVGFAQDGFFQRIKNCFVIHDTVYIYVNGAEVDTIMEEADVIGDTMDDGTDENADDTEDEHDEQRGGIPMPIDTLDTHDIFQKVVLFDNGTWLYYNIDMAFIPYAIESDHWITEKVHSYNDIALKDFPDTVELTLVDSLHRYCIPHPGRVTSRYKYRGKRPHRGIDIGLHTGDAIYAAFDGVVRTALPANLTGGYGNALVIRHPNGLETYYGHLSYFIVKSGDIVKAGELIGYGGSTGRSTGPHLHFETRFMGQAFDPERIFDFESGTLRSEVFILRKHYFNINSHYGMTDEQSAKATTKAPKSGSGGGLVYYKVKKGDTLAKIAQRNGTTVKKLCQLNGIKSNTVLSVGRRLRVK
jgi:murein DD-endopeptidase MepM/ murein hydrolase activator NlpD